jgi:hypothetical protein
MRFRRRDNSTGIGIASSSYSFAFYLYLYSSANLPFSETFITSSSYSIARYLEPCREAFYDFWEGPSLVVPSLITSRSGSTSDISSTTTAA